MHLTWMLVHMRCSTSVLRAVTWVCTHEGWARKTPQAQTFKFFPRKLAMECQEGELQGDDGNYWVLECNFGNEFTVLAQRCWDQTGKAALENAENSAALWATHAQAFNCWNPECCHSTTGRVLCFSWFLDFCIRDVLCVRNPQPLLVLVLLFPCNSWLLSSVSWIPM